MRSTAQGPRKISLPRLFSAPYGSRKTRWMDCPNCRQSATASYDRKLACTRCGWKEGNLFSCLRGALTR